MFTPFGGFYLFSHHKTKKMARTFFPSHAHFFTFHPKGLQKTSANNQLDFFEQILFLKRKVLLLQFNSLESLKIQKFMIA